MNNPDLSLSAIICTYNRCNLLEDALEALFRVNGFESIPWEIVVVDNNSTDATEKVVEKYAARSPNFPLRYCKEKNAGVAWARNKGVEEARSDVIVFVDDDVRVSEQWLMAIVTTLEENKDAAIIGGRLLPPVDEKLPDWAQNQNLSPLGLIDYGEEKKVMTLPYLLTGNCVFQKREIINDGMFNTHKGRMPDKLYADEDVDMIKRIQIKGGLVLYQPTILGYHILQPERLKLSYFFRWHFERGEGLGLVGPEGSRSLFGIRLFEYRDVLLHAYYFIIAGGKRKSRLDNAFKILHFFGLILGAVKRKLRGLSHKIG